MIRCDVDGCNRNARYRYTHFDTRRVTYRCAPDMAEAILKSDLLAVEVQSMVKLVKE